MAVNASVSVTILTQQLLIDVAGVLAALIRVMNKARASLAPINSHLARALLRGLPQANSFQFEFT
jgi:hypothetical protein